MAGLRHFFRTQPNASTPVSAPSPTPSSGLLSTSGRSPPSSRPHRRRSSGVVAVMAAIQSGGIGATSGLGHAEAYDTLADLLMHGLARRRAACGDRGGSACRG